MQFQRGDQVCNVNPASLFYGLRGVFVGYWSEGYTFYRGRACDVEYPGVVDLYGRKEIAQCANDLLPVVNGTMPEHLSVDSQ